MLVKALLLLICKPDRIVDMLAAWLLLLVIVAPVAAQDLNPPGAIPWEIPKLPYLRSPTPWPTVPTPTPQAITDTPTPTPTATATATGTLAPMPTVYDGIATISVDSDQAMATIQAIGDQEGLATAAVEIGDRAGMFFGYAKGLQLFNIRGTGGVVTFMILLFTFVILVKLATAVMPMLGTVAGWLFDLIRLIGEFIPL